MLARRIACVIVTCRLAVEVWSPLPAAKHRPMGNSSGCKQATACRGSPASVTAGSRLSMCSLNVKMKER